MMDLDRTAHWLFAHGGPVIHQRVAVEYKGAFPPADVEALQRDLLANAAVRQWLDNLKSYETLVEERRQGTGLGAGGHSSFLHGSTDFNFEVVLPKLAQLGLRAGIPQLDEKTNSWLNLLANEVEKDYARIFPDDSQFLSRVYSYYDRRLIVASSLAVAGYAHHKSVKQVILSRLDAIYELVKKGTFDIYEEPGRFKVSPKAWANHLLKWELYADGNIRLPFTHDIFGFTALYPGADRLAKHKIDTIIQWILAPEHQHFLYNYGYIRCPDGRGKSVGHKINFPGYFGFDSPDFDPNGLVLRCWQMARFPDASAHPWFRNSMQHLMRFKSDRGTFIFPAPYLPEARNRGYWINGDRMGLGENRRNPRWCELESTFWMFAIQLAIETCD
jgi:hypothetical protein